jgi:hypothetical protein
VIRVAVSAAAYAAIVAWDASSVQEPEQAPNGEFYLWLFKPVLQKLSGAREPGESFSDTILRLSQP